MVVFNVHIFIIQNMNVEMVAQICYTKYWLKTGGALTVLCIMLINFELCGSYAKMIMMMMMMMMR